MFTTDFFPNCLEFTLRCEGGYTNNAADPGNWTGGAVGQGTCKGTNFGISAAAYPDLDIINLTRDGAGAIYRRDYWTPLRCGEMPYPVALVVFDTGVNLGVGYAAHQLQHVLDVTPDGVIGPETLAALGKRTVSDVVQSYLVGRTLAYMTLAQRKPEFLEGWVHRAILLSMTEGAILRAD